MLILQQQVSRDLCSRPYILGLTGGIASGKSSLCQRLEKLGAAIVDCDKLGNLFLAHIKATLVDIK